MPDTKRSSGKLQRPKGGYPDTVLVNRGKPASAMVCPDDAPYRELASELGAAIRDLTGADVPLVLDTAAKTPPDLQTMPLACVRRLDKRAEKRPNFSCTLQFIDDTESMMPDSRMWMPGTDGRLRIRTEERSNEDY